MLEIEKPVRVTSGTLSVIVSPPEFAKILILNYLEYYRSLLFISGNFSTILPSFSRLNINFTVRRAFTAYQLLEILEDAEHDMVFIESTFEEAEELNEVLFLGMRDISRRGSIVILYSPVMNGFMDFTGRNSDRMIIVRKVNGGFVVWDSGNEIFIHNHQNMTLGDFHG
jgi:hypothetical protein